MSFNKVFAIRQVPKWAMSLSDYCSGDAPMYSVAQATALQKFASSLISALPPKSDHDPDVLLEFIKKYHIENGGNPYSIFAGTVCFNIWTQFSVKRAQLAGTRDPDPFGIIVSQCVAEGRDPEEVRKQYLSRKLEMMA